MVHRVLVTVSFVCCALIVASFTFFAVDQVSGASGNQVAAIAGSATSGKKQHVRPGPLRRFVDAAAKDLTYPFHSVLLSTSRWANQLLLLVLGLTVYGVGLGYLARYSSGVA